MKENLQSSAAPVSSAAQSAQGGGLRGSMAVAMAGAAPQKNAPYNEDISFPNSSNSKRGGNGFRG